MSQDIRTNPRRRVPDVFDWLENLPSFSSWPRIDGVNGFRLEEDREDHKIVIRAELPGFDPKDISAEFTDDELVITAERKSDRTESNWSEFRYGTFSRRVRLPKTCDPDQATARYESGILEIAIPVADAPAKPKQLTITEG